MKVFRFFTMALLASSLSLLTGCSDKDGDDDNGGGETPDQQILFGDGTQIGDGSQEFEIVGKHTLKKGVYVLKGWVYITDGASLTIEPGTIIKGDKDTKAAIIAERGGKLIADGTVSQPIVFTSNQPKGKRNPGDWGGIILCGRAKNNQTKMQIEGGPRTEHGGDNDGDSSGILRYVRCEFAGFPFDTDMEINGITFGSVGSGTQVDHVQVSYSSDDSYEWFGGSVNAKYLIAYHGWDDDFDTDNGFSGKLQYLLAVRHPKLADNSLSNGFESDNQKDGATLEPYTTAVFSNVTIVGPMGQDPAFVNNSSYIDAGTFKPAAKLGSFQAAMQIRRSSRLNCFNSVAMGYPVGLLLDNQKGTTHAAATEGKLNLQNLYFAGMGVLGSDINKQANGWTDQLSTDGTNITDPTKPSFSSTFFNLAANNNKSYATIADLKLNQPNSLNANANWGPKSDSPLVGKSNLFVHALLQTGFDKVNYIGAFKSDSDADNWTKGWANFDPQNADY